MYLSRSACAAALAEAAKHGIESDDPERIVKQALEAIVLGAAEEIAYKVVEAAGIEIIAPGIWAQLGGNAVNATTARAVIKQAQDDETYDGAMPDDDDKAIEVATGLVDMAQDAWNQNVRGPEVQKLLEIAKGSDNGDGPASKPSAPSASKPRPRPAKKEEPAPEPEKEPEDARAGIEPWDGYSENKVEEVIEGIEVWAEQGETDDVTHVFLYEQAHQNRKRIIERILELVPSLAPSEGAAAEPTPEPEPEPEPEHPPVFELPFEGYDDLKAVDIKSAVEEWFSGDIEQSDALAWLNNAFAYEAHFKNRSTLLDYFDSKRKAMGGQEEPSAAQAGAGAAADTDAGEADAGGADAAAGGESGGEEPRAAAGAGSASGQGAAAGTAYTVTGTFGTSQVIVEAVSQLAVAAFVLDLLQRGANNVTVVSGG
jgi:hypothetical protein